MPLIRSTMASLASMATLAGAVAALSATSAASSPLPTGVWIDHTGRGAVEITECFGGLCGHIVWVKDPKHIKTCRNQVLGNVKPVGGNTWDRGWIVDPDDNARYSVELKPVGQDRLRVVGYMGSKLFSETMMWKRAPADLKRCDGKETPAATPVAVPAPGPAAAPAAPIALPPPALPPAVLPPAVLPPAVLPPALARPAPDKGVEQPPLLPAEVIRPSELPQKHAAAPPLLPPGATTQPAEPEIARPAETPVPQSKPLPESKIGPRRKVASSAPAETEPNSPAPRTKRKSSSRNCTLDLPYVTLKYPCDAF